MKNTFLLLLSAVAVAGMIAADGCKKNNETDNTIVKPKDDSGNEETSDVDVVTPDNWAAVDELGRVMPIADAPAARSGKTVALFYWTWHDSRQLMYPSVVNISTIIRDHPEALNDYSNPLWGQELQPCFWGQPLFGYYRTTDPWVLRKHAELLADAGVDVVFFDCTNGDFTWQDSYTALCKSWTQAQKDGVKTPKIAFLLPFGATEGSLSSLRKLYADIYKPQKYQSLWYRINGVPMIMAYPDNLTADATDQAIKNFFTFRPGQPDYVSGASREGQWGWLECYPQHEYNHGEQMTVGVAQNTNEAHNGHAYAFNAPETFGRSYTKANGQDNSPMAYVKGLNFQEQWDRALKLDPKVVFITGWNEWIAGKQPNWPPSDPYKPFAFPDEYDSERSRDIEPNAEWGDYGDVYYYQMVMNIRKFKGVAKAPRVSAAKTMTIGSFEGWDKISPDYKHYPGNTLSRNHPQHSQSGVIYTNNTGRNDFVDARVERDKDYIYFYVKTKDAISVYTGNAWMRLFINIDRKASTGWKGYDFLLNYKNPSSNTQGTVSKCTGSTWEWQDAGTFEYAVKGDMMELKVAKSVLGVSGHLDLEFKWSDNMQHDGDILDFYSNGDCAPGARFNFVYTAD